MLYAVALSIGMILLPSLSVAEITKIVIEKREPFADGHEFGVTGAYEKLIGKAYGEVNPDTKHNKGIVNLEERRATSAAALSIRWIFSYSSPST